MKTIWYLLHWKPTGEQKLLKVYADDIEDLKKKLAIEISDHEDEVRINGHNYNYITHISHCNAAGFPPDILEGFTIQEALSPAHFNREFFFILR